MKTYEVTLPIAGVAFLTVEAESEEQAIGIAMNECSQENIEEWSAYRNIVSGNVLYAPYNEAVAQQVSDGSY